MSVADANRRNKLTREADDVALELDSPAVAGASERSRPPKSCVISDDDSQQVVDMLVKQRRIFRARVGACSSSVGLTCNRKVASLSVEMSLSKTPPPDCSRRAGCRLATLTQPLMCECASLWIKVSAKGPKWKCKCHSTELHCRAQQGVIPACGHQTFKLLPSESIAWPLDLFHPCCYNPITHLLCMIFSAGIYGCGRPVISLCNCCIRTC